MPLGSAAKTKIDIDFTRAHGVNSSGVITFTPPRVRVGTTIVENTPVSVLVEDGVASVELVRLPAGTYSVHEKMDGRSTGWSFNFALPLDAADVIRYETVAPVSPIPPTYTSVRTINGVPPNPTTGNVTIAVGGATTLDGLTDVETVAPLNNQVLLYSTADTKWKNLALAAVSLTGLYDNLIGTPNIPTSPGDVGAAAAAHLHTVSDITDFVDSVDARIENIVGAAPAALDTLAELAEALNNDADFHASVTIALAGKAALAHAHAISDITGLVAALAAKQAPIVTRDGYFTPAGDSTALPNSGGVWAALDGIELSIPAAVGDRLRLGVHGMRNAAGGAVLDFASIVGSSPTLIKKYLATGTSSPAFEGDPGWYVASTFINQSAPRQLTVTADDRDGGNVRVGLVFKSNGTGIVYRSPNYPLYMLLENIGPEPA